MASIQDVLSGKGSVQDWAKDRPAEALAALLGITLLLVLLTSRR